MSKRELDLPAALEDVRRAYRLVYAYQRRIQDLLTVIDRHLTKAGLPFVQWAPLFFRAPVRSRKKFFERKWAWDLLPAYAFWCAWETPKDSKALSRRVALSVVADTGFPEGPASEPDPDRFPGAAESRSQLQLSLFSSDAARIDWDHAWPLFAGLGDEVLYGAQDRFVEFKGARCCHRYREIELSDLADEQAVSDKLLERLSEWIKAPLPPQPRPG